MFIIKQVNPDKELIEKVQNRVGEYAREMLLYNVCTFKQFVAMSGIPDPTVRYNTLTKTVTVRETIPPRLDTEILFRDGDNGGREFIILNEKAKKVIMEGKF